MKHNTHSSECHDSYPKKAVFKIVSNLAILISKSRADKNEKCKQWLIPKSYMQNIEQDTFFMLQLTDQYFSNMLRSSKHFLAQGNGLDSKMNKVKIRSRRV